MSSERLPQIVLGIAQNEAKEVLVVRRAKEEKGTDNVQLSWVFPGGKVEENEEKEEAIEREILEETGYQVSAISIISERQHPQFPVYIFYIECQLKSSEAVGQPNDVEIRKVVWVHPSKLNEYFTTDLDPKVAEHLGLK